MSVSLSACHLRVARPVSDLVRATAMYCDGLGLKVVGSFENHEGFDGVMLGGNASYHFELTYCRTRPVRPTPTHEDLVVFYVPDVSEWRSACAQMESAGFAHVQSFNPYWEIAGRTFEDFDGYRVVLENRAWK